MNTDVALNYKAKLTNIEEKIKEIAAIGFNMNTFKEELEKIISDTNSKVRVSKKNTFEGFIIADYSSAISRLEKLDNALDSFEIYVKINNYTEYLERNDVSKEKISEVVKEVLSLLKTLANSSVIDYEEEKKIVEPFYNIVFKVICYEIYYTGRSELLVYCTQNDIDKTFIERKIKDCLKEIDLKKYPEIAAKYYEIKRNGLNCSLLDADFIRLLVFKDEKEKLKANILDSANKKINEIKSVETQLESKLNQRYSYISRKKEELYYLKDSIKELSKSIISLAIALSIPIGSFLITKSIYKKENQTYSYDVKKETYSSYDNSINETVEREVIDPQEVESKAYAIKYKCNQSDRDSSEKSVYDLSFLNKNNLQDYIDYWKSGVNLEPSKISNIVLNDEDNIVKENIDYYEIVYSYVDLESKNIIDNTTNLEEFYTASAITFVVCFIELIAIMILIELKNFNIFDLRINEKFNELIDSLHCYNYSKEMILNKTKELMDLIGQNDKLRKAFNIEAQKYKYLFEELGIKLPKETIDEKTKKKILGEK